MRNAILTLLLFGLLAAHANPDGLYEGLTMARLRGNAVEPSEPWTPADLTGLALWLDASDASTVTTNAGATAWNDKSGNARHYVQATESLRPAYVLAARNGNNLLRFASDEMQSTNQMINGASSYTLAFKLNEIPTLGNQATVLNMRHSSTNRTGFEIINVNTYIPYTVVNDQGSTIPSCGYNKAISTNSQIFAWSYNGGPNSSTSSYSIAQDGGIKTLTTGGNINFLDAALSKIGTRIGQTTYANMDMYEIVVAGSVLSSTDRQKLEGYLAHKWGLAGNLPADHPYKSAAPTK